VSVRTTAAPAANGTVEAETAIDLLRRMLEIPSPSYEERPLAEFLIDAMRALGLSAHLDEAGNAVGGTGTGRGPVVMLLGHLDTISGEVPVRRVAGRLYGRGAVDAKGPLAAMVMAAARSRDFPGRLIVVGAVEEETPRSRGAVYVTRTVAMPAAVIVGEPSGWSNVVLGYKGKLDLVYHVRRPATHPSNPVEKATEATAAFWSTAVDMLGPDHGHGSFDRPGVTLCAMRGDLEHAELDISYRTPVGFDHEQLVTALRERARGGAVEVVNAVRAVRVDRRDPVVRALSAGIRRHGGTPRPKVKTATSDMNTLAEVWQVPMATYGPGDSKLDHSSEEHILLDDYLRGIAVLHTALAELADAKPSPMTSHEYPPRSF
jgi:[amino group carrier protein]-lysine/ornithine hydrolase